MINRHTTRRALAALALGWAAALAPAIAQTFGAASCGASTTDSTCFTAGYGAACSTPPVLTEQRQSCPAGYVGSMVVKGARDSCTGVTTYTPPNANDGPGCTNCDQDLNAIELNAMVSALLELSTQFNVAFTDRNCPQADSCLDGTTMLSPLTNTSVGRFFRARTWADPEAFGSGQLPTTNRVRYLISQGRVKGNFAPHPSLPKDSQGNPITNVGQLYVLAVDAATQAAAVSCSGGADGCHMSCTTPAAGMIGPTMCSSGRVDFSACSDTYYTTMSPGASTAPSYSGPTSSVNLPFTSYAPRDFTTKNFSWPDDLSFNGQPSTGGPIYLCSSDIVTCNGWETQSMQLGCKVGQAFTCTVDSSGAQSTCGTCDPSYGGQWDYLLTQVNNCPLVPGMSTRSFVGQTRQAWLSDLQSQAQCGALPASPGLPFACGAHEIVDAGATGCTCAPGYYRENGACTLYVPSNVGALGQSILVLDSSGYSNAMIDYSSTYVLRTSINGKRVDLEVDYPTDHIVIGYTSYTKDPDTGASLPTGGRCDVYPNDPNQLTCTGSAATYYGFPTTVTFTFDPATKNLTGSSSGITTGGLPYYGYDPYGGGGG